jgi:hypothetical protein
MVIIMLFGLISILVMVTLGVLALMDMDDNNL